MGDSQAAPAHCDSDREPRTLSDNTRIPLRVPRMEAKSGDALTGGFRHIVYPIGS